LFEKPRAEGICCDAEGSARGCQEEALTKGG
jgi:hypothetical protein